MALKSQLMLVSGLDCPACGDSPHAVHVDGNHKLFVWDRQQGHNRRATTADILYAQDCAVQDHLAYLDLALGPNQQVCSSTCCSSWVVPWLTICFQQVDARCNGLWRAADVNKAPGNKYCTGRVYGMYCSMILYNVAAIAACSELHAISLAHKAFWNSPILDRLTTRHVGLPMHFLCLSCGNNPFLRALYCGSCVPPHHPHGGCEHDQDW